MGQNKHHYEVDSNSIESLLKQMDLDKNKEKPPPAKQLYRIQSIEGTSEQGLQYMKKQHTN